VKTMAAIVAAVVETEAAMAAVRVGKSVSVYNVQNKCLRQVAGGICFCFKYFKPLLF